MLNYEYTLWLDLDGVLADFERKVSDISTIPFASMKKSSVWYHIQRYNDNVKPFFESLDKMQDADDLLDWVVGKFGTIKILSACGHTPKGAADQKRKWVADNVEPRVPHIVAKIVTSSEQKAQYASPTSILVDDRMKSIDPWVRAGGIGVHHQNTNDTIRQLELLLAK